MASLTKASERKFINYDFYEMQQILERMMYQTTQHGYLLCATTVVRHEVSNPSIGQGNM